MLVLIEQIFACLLALSLKRCNVQTFAFEEAKPNVSKCAFEGAKANVPKCARVHFRLSHFPGLACPTDAIEFLRKL